MSISSRLWFVQLRRLSGDTQLLADRLARGERVIAHSTLEVLELLDDGRAVLQRYGSDCPRMGCARLSDEQYRQVAGSLAQGRLPLVHFCLELVSRSEDGSFLAVTDSPVGQLFDAAAPLLPALSDLLGASHLPHAA